MKILAHLAVPLAFACVSSAARAEPTTFFINTDFSGCFSTIGTGVTSYAYFGYESWIDCDVTSSSCNWNTQVTENCNNGADLTPPVDQSLCCAGGQAISSSIQGLYAPTTADVMGRDQGNICLCYQNGTDPVSSPGSLGSCITLASKWVDLTGWPENFTNAAYRYGGCTPAEMTSNVAYIESYSGWEYPVTATQIIHQGYSVTTDQMNQVEKNGVGAVVMAAQHAALIFTPEGDLTMNPVSQGGLFAVPQNHQHQYWHSNTAGKGYQFIFQMDGNLVVYDKKGNALWAANTASTEISTPATALEIEADCNLSAWNVTGSTSTMVWQDGDGFCPSYVGRQEVTWYSGANQTGSATAGSYGGCVNVGDIGLGGGATESVSLYGVTGYSTNGLAMYTSANCLGEEFVATAQPGAVNNVNLATVGIGSNLVSYQILQPNGPQTYPPSETLLMGHTITAGNGPVTTDGMFQLTMQSDGNLVIKKYNGDGSSENIWWLVQQITPGDWAIMQDDGNFVVYAPDGHAVWATDSNRNGTVNGAYLTLEHDASQGFVFLTVWGPDGTSLWNSVSDD